MKRLISADHVYKAMTLGQNIYIDENTIVTPMARDVAKDKGVQIIFGSSENHDQHEEKHECCPNEVVHDWSKQEDYNVNKECCSQATNNCTSTHHEPHKTENCGCCGNKTGNGPILSPEEIYKVLKFAFDKGILKEGDLLKYM